MTQWGKNLAEDRNTSNTVKRGPRPIAWHPLFPAIVATWCAALFGLGALAVRTALLEAAAVASGIDKLVPAAAPPLGTNARILIALALALLGAAVGAIIGHLLARSKPSARARRAEAAAAKAARSKAREAAAAVTVSAKTADEAPNFIDISLLNLDDTLRIEPGPAPEAEFIAPEPEADPAVEASEPKSPPAPGTAAAAQLTGAALDSLSHVELIERLAVSLHKRREDAEEASEDGELPPRSAADTRLAAELRAVLSPVPSYYPPAPEPATPRFAQAQFDAEGEDSSSDPVALFPNHDATPYAAPRQDGDDTERALRDALAALQRMSGAA
jgi:hypothetical protein